MLVYVILNVTVLGAQYKCSLYVLYINHVYIHSYNSTARRFVSTVLMSAYTDASHLQFGTQLSDPTGWGNGVLELSPEQQSIRATTAMGVLNSVSSSTVRNFTLYVCLFTFSGTFYCSAVIHAGRHISLRLVILRDFR